MNSFTFENVFNQAFSTFKGAFLKSFVLLIPFAIVCTLLFLGSIRVDNILISIVGLIILALCVYVLLILLNKILLNVALGKPVFDKLFLSGRQWINIFLYLFIILAVYGIIGFMYFLGIGLGLSVSPILGILLVVTSAVLALVVSLLIFFKYFFVAHIILAKDKNIIEAFRESPMMTQGNKLMMFGLYVVIGFIFMIFFGILDYLIVPIISTDFASLMNDAYPVYSITTSFIIAGIVYSLCYYLAMFFEFAFGVSMYKALQEKMLSKKSNKMQRSN